MGDQSVIERPDSRTMTPNQIIEHVFGALAGVVPKSSWGETAVFYNPGSNLPNDVYFCTIKQRDGENDKVSDLNRDGFFRLSIGLSRPSYHWLFGDRPPRPAKGRIVTTGRDFAALNELMPHPIYAWMGWVQVLSPTTERFAELAPLIQDAHSLAVAKFDKRQTWRS
jgi:Family of unknown function (DUF6194)